MPDLNAWAGSTFPLTAWSDDADKAYDIARVIGDKTTSISVRRGAATLDAQTVRIETTGGGGQIIDAAGRQHQVGCIVLGYHGHPTITDTNLQPGDRFGFESARYEVVAVLVNLPDALQAICVAMT